MSRLVTVTVSGQIAHPVAAANPYRIGADGVPRVLPGTGGIVQNLRVGDLCIGLAGDHIEPGVALHNNGREVTGPRNGPNNALLTYSCVGNRALVLNGPCRGKVGIVTGKHGGVNHVLVDFPTAVLRRLRIGDRLSIESRGLGLRLPEHPRVELFNCSPALLERWRLGHDGARLHVPVTHRIPAALMGSGLGKNTAWRGDYDIQLADAPMTEKHQLGSLRFGDLVAVVDSSTRHGPSHRAGQITVGIVVHGDSTVSGHGPGVTPLMSGPASEFRLHRDPHANLAALFDLRRPATPRFRRTLIDADKRARLHDSERIAAQMPAHFLR